MKFYIRYIENLYKLLRSFFVFIILFLFFLIAIFYVYYLYKYPTLIDNGYLSKYYSKDIILKTGGLLLTPEEKFQHFLNFAVKKNKGVIRIGTFGDSHTFGSEVGERQTYPYQLQELFNQQFPKTKIEVLNFGIPSNSFQDQYILYKHYAKNYALDYILLGPRMFYPYRDVRFRYNYGFKNLRHPKNRYILSHAKYVNFWFCKSLFFNFIPADTFQKEHVKQVHIKGKTLKRRYKNYYTLIPQRTALCYDKRPFYILEMFFPFLRDSIENPFYYTNLSEAKESAKINLSLLKNIKKWHK